MNILQRAYEEGVKLAGTAHGVGKLVAPGVPRAPTPTPSTTMAKSPSTGGAVAAPGGGGGGKSPSIASSSVASTIPSLAPGAFGKGLPPQNAITPQTLATQAGAAGAGQVFQLGSAGQRQSMRTMGTELPGIASAAGPAGAGASGFKAGEFNMGMTPDPASKPDKVPAPDNGRRMTGNRFNDPQHPLGDISSAWNAQGIPKNTDVLNEAGQMAFGAPRG